MSAWVDRTESNERRDLCSLEKDLIVEGALNHLEGLSKRTCHSSQPRYRKTAWDSLHFLGKLPDEACDLGEVFQRSKAHTEQSP